MTDLELMIEFCKRFSHEYVICPTYDGGVKVWLDSEDEYYFNSDGSLSEQSPQCRVYLVAPRGRGVLYKKNPLLWKIIVTLTEEKFQKPLDKEKKV